MLVRFPFCLTASSVHAGSVLIRKEMVLVIMSTLVTRNDNAQYYFYAMLCARPQLPILIKRKNILYKGPVLMSELLIFPERSGLIQNVCEMEGA